MKSLVIDENKAKVLYKDASPDLKDTLVHTFGREFFLPKITDRVNSWDDVLKIHSFSNYLFDKKDETAFKQLKLITEIYNEGWVPDWDDESEYKYYLTFKIKGTFSLLIIGKSSIYIFVPSSLVFKSEELARNAAEKFLPIYEAYYNPKP